MYVYLYIVYSFDSNDNKSCVSFMMTEVRRHDASAAIYPLCSQPHIHTQYSFTDSHTFNNYNQCIIVIIGRVPDITNSKQVKTKMDTAIQKLSIWGLQYEPCLLGQR